VNSTVSGQGSVAGCCKCGDEPSRSGATEPVFIYIQAPLKLRHDSRSSGQLLFYCVYTCRI
jgi:hypothetical protein